MIRLELLLPRSSPPVDQASGASSTTLQVQPAAGSGAERAPSDPFARTSRPTIDMEAVRAGMRIPVNTTVVDLSIARSIALGNALILPIQGTAYFIDKGPDVGLATIHIQDQGSPPVNTISVFPGDANNNIPFTFWMIENSAQVGKVLRIHYGTDIIFQPGIGGNISLVVTPQTDLDSANGQRFTTGSNFSVPAVAGQFGFAQLFNPANSGKTLYVDNCSGTPVAAGTIQLLYSNVAQGAQGAVAPQPAVNFRLDQPASIAQLRQGTNILGPQGFTFDLAAVGAGATQRWSQNGGTPNDVPLAGPIIVPPGFGFIVFDAGTANEVLKASMQWREK